jgi:hypothetical protein
VVTKPAARLLVLTYNLWRVFTRLLGLNPGQHTEAIKSEWDFLLLAAQVVESGRQRVAKLAVKAERWAKLKACYERLRAWLAAVGPQLEAAREIPRRLARQKTENPYKPSSNPAAAEPQLRILGSTHLLRKGSSRRKETARLPASRFHSGPVHPLSRPLRIPSRQTPRSRLITARPTKRIRTMFMIAPTRENANTVCSAAKVSPPKTSIAVRAHRRPRA